MRVSVSGELIYVETLAYLGAAIKDSAYLHYREAKTNGGAADH